MEQIECDMLANAIAYGNFNEALRIAHELSRKNIKVQISPKENNFTDTRNLTRGPSFGNLRFK